MPVIKPATLPVISGHSSYPAEYRARTDLYEAIQMGDAVGLTQFGVALETLAPGGLSSLRHWHENEDEFLYMLEGEVVLVEDDGEHILRPGDAAGWKAGVPNGHHLQNRSERPARYLIMGTRAQTERAHYPDIDLLYTRDGDTRGFSRRDGSPIKPPEGSDT